MSTALWILGMWAASSVGFLVGVFVRSARERNDDRQSERVTGEPLELGTWAYGYDGNGSTAT